MKSFLVTWEINVDAESPEQAAKLARHYQLKPDSTADVFDVIECDGDGKVVRIDLTELREAEAATPKARSSYTLTFDHRKRERLSPSNNDETLLFRLLNATGTPCYSGFATNNDAVLAALNDTAGGNSSCAAQIMVRGRYVNLT
jgi:hypothetical protein